MAELISIDQIQQQAIAAAERGDEPTVCQYVKDSEFERVWRDAYFTRVYELSGEASI